MRNLTSKQELSNYKQVQTASLELAYSQEKKIRVIAKKNPEQILQAINYLYVLLSVKDENRLNEIEESVLNGLIITSFKNYSLNEIKHAFRLALAGTIEAPLYCKLDAITLSAVMKAYKKHKDNILKQELNKTKKPDELTEAEKKAIESEFIEVCVNKYLLERKTLKEPKISSELYSVFMYFYRSGNITLTDAEIDKYKQLSINYWLQELKEKRAKGDRINAGAPMPASRQKVISSCLALYDKIK